ncbi:hypothetical protein [Spiroplasma alleghenense]|uniref:Uncharacterized protein n=1 Tax=Spiroplasma alleghenense TaxID=216931 RepID=A0A345Z4K9_9MOLU|nr:hypothetical protein [Spiroplasma alleghenense]AXK51538.1 hypothetical protein SALLE_v1c08680 [Spiroplasma alleghenense]
MKNSIFDKTIFKYSFKRTALNIPILVCTSVLLIFSIILSSLLVTMGQTYVFAIILFFIFLTINLTVFNLVNLSKIFLTDMELGVMNLEIRKGRNNKAIFWSRLFSNLIVSVAIIATYMIIFIIILAIKNPSELKNFPMMFFLIIPLNLIIVGTFLLIFSFRKFKLAIALSTLISVLIIPSPLLGMTASIFINEDSQLNLQNDIAIFSNIRNQTLNLLKNGNEVVDRVLNEANLLNDLFELGEESPILTKQELMITSLNSGIYNIEDLKIAYKKPENENHLEGDFPKGIKDTLLIKVNSEIIGESESNNLSRNYKESFYLNQPFNNKQFQFTKNEFEKTINLINGMDLGFSKNHMKEFNKLVYTFGINQIWNSRSTNQIFNNEVMEFIFPTINDQLTPKLHDFLKKGEINTPVGLRVWNQAVAQIFSAALYQEDLGYEKLNIAKVNAYNFFFPWAMTYETIVNPNPFLNDFQILRNNKNETASFSTYIFDNGHKYINIAESEDLEYSGYAIPGVEIVESKQISKSNKLFNKIGYEAFLLATSLVMIEVSYLIFSKKLKL